MLSSFRSRLLLLVVAVSVPPLAMTGFWLTRSVSTSGDRIVRDRLHEAAERAAENIARDWVPIRSRLLSVLESAASGEVGVGSGGASPGHGLSDERLGGGALANLPEAVREVRIRSAAGTTILEFDRHGDFRGAGVPVRLRSPRDIPGGPLTLDARIDTEYLLGAAITAAREAGATLSVVDPVTEASLLALPFDPAAAREGRFQWGGEEWLAVLRPLPEPRLDLIVATRTAPYVPVLRQQARQGVSILGVIAGVTLVLGFLWSRHLTRSLSELASSASAVAAGDLRRRVPIRGSDEVARVAEAFNGMTASLETNLRQMSNRESLATLGEFAGELAHEVRNPLSAIRLELQFVQERLEPGSPLAEAQQAALAQVRRLDATVASVLLASRSGRLDSLPLRIDEPLTRACASAEPLFRERNARLERRFGSCDHVVRGDPVALERLFLNLLTNAAEALPVGGLAEVAVTLAGTHTRITIRDSGVGIGPDELERIFERGFSGKRTGTGLGLSIARRIVEGHGGSIGIESDRHRGTAVHVLLPLSADEPDDVPAT